ncbi:peptide-methionine (S)-S-oxide reductase MsrA [Prosthecobacter dejongeii]|uniref:Peptide methionine sulfoxide reductase MsrA n=1 Tax=Prosthecobacter dejongeii TaxID=48465 RepID=A0A7W7YI67_9BACT|nr:peptide-methionine (S)-S-oxide reductase MsrA [Prosthecobacter dejongeii]MBB5036670.1 peptide-methionine (S)-S-oxide reductase [Prosthecobacter dejongeii]
MKTFLSLLAAMSTALTPAIAADPAPATPAGKTELAVLGGGCFWCTEAQYEMLKGVKTVVSGYCNGITENPTYKEVCAGDTQHNEVIQIEFDPTVISYKEIVDYFWIAHDPTTLNRQGNDVGDQYRSGIYYLNEEQKKIAQESMKAAQKDWDQPIVTEIVPLKKFYVAEDYHQDYFANNPSQGYCRAVVSPKVSKFRAKLAKEGKFKE